METKEPKLEDYQLNIDSYQNLRAQEIDLEKLENNYISTLSIIISIIIIITIILGAIFNSIIIFVLGFLISYLVSTYSNYESERDKETKRQIKEIQNKIEPIRKQIFLFKNASEKYYINYLDSFFQEKLYKKRSGSKEFEDTLQEFHQMISEIHEIDRKIIFLNMGYKISFYESYLKERESNHTYQKCKKNIFNTFKDIKSYESEERKGHTTNLIGETAKRKIQIIAPERKYNTVRKIDNWEIINKKRKETGDKGEEIVLAVEKEYLESIGRKDLSEKVYHISKEKGDGMGYDILSFFDNGEEKYIEVKSTTKAIETQFNISKNELEFLKINSRNALLYRVGVSTEPPEIEIKTGLQILESEIIPVTFIVKTKK
ncbi:MAG: DUF3883 domain-containing protein [Candidatus Pacebacteria bacterium]|nr:DUF3883 domain-containing protein [Candidatus Paceibacterota bacterium]